MARIIGNFETVITTPKGLTYHRNTGETISDSAYINENGVHIRQGEIAQDLAQAALTWETQNDMEADLWMMGFTQQKPMTERAAGRWVRGDFQIVK